jgi:hypothetical protein
MAMFFRPHVFLTPIGLTHVPIMPPIPLPPAQPKPTPEPAPVVSRVIPTAAVRAQRGVPRGRSRGCAALAAFGERGWSCALVVSRIYRI